MNNKRFHNSRTFNEMGQINSEHSDFHRCEDKDTNRKIRMSHNDFRKSIKHLPIWEPFSVMDTIPNIEDI